MLLNPRTIQLFISFSIFLTTFSLHAADDIPALVSENTDSVVSYPESFFSQYQPITALDMVERVPGFSVDNGDDSRGFGGAAGNMLVNGERPSTKQDTVSDILRRIPASQVERVDLIRGQGGGLDLRGQSVAVNVVLKTDTSAAFTWETLFEQDFDSGPLTPRGIISATQRYGSTQFNLGLDIRRFFFGNPATELLFQPINSTPDADLTISERRIEYERTKGHEVNTNLNTETRLNETLIHFNGEVNFQSRQFIERSARTPQNTPSRTRNVNQDQERDRFRLELGADMEWPLSKDLYAKAITLYRVEDDERLTSISTPDDTPAVIQTADTDNRTTENIARLEFDWTGWAQHTLEFDLEGAFNTLDNELVLTSDEGNGPEPIPVPGANSRVEEIRGDFRIADSWIWQHWVMETALGAEISNISQFGISQSGDNGNDRDFFFWKPSWSLTYAANQNQQTRIRIVREVGQLDFDNFVSSTNFNDDDVDLGNANLSPDRTWRTELSFERRFGSLGAATLILNHSWVQDVQDVLPIGGIFEVPGNIGNGRQWGAELEATVPLSPIGLENGRLDIEAGWRDSSVTDPVTQRQRDFSLLREWDIQFRFRQDLQEQRWAWGGQLEFIGGENFYGIDELDRFDEGVDLELFIETTRWWGIKTRLTFETVSNREFVRDRRVYVGQRDLSPLLFRELRDRRRGRSVVLSFSGSF